MLRASLRPGRDTWSRTGLYRNDRAPQAGRSPHGFLLDPRSAPATQQGQVQVATFLGDGAVADPNGPGVTWEVPISAPELLLPLDHASAATRP
ncbi:hypothetical protein SAMN05660642_03359 [Geodermatophilus siccatus]|uniref:Uncharacterized protein n=1 Tax=Geodermatophilus siccatus TaxID=1137991 RepID=A0A1G9WDY2_9ACTN|nr:hypothetical protein [Geodermatophilus siccatus]SDM82752.1 hypothetical protein SAMN05660642_03359 [Geodermatophilus siccatus]